MLNFLFKPYRDETFASIMQRLAARSGYLGIAVLYKNLSGSKSLETCLNRVPAGYLELAALLGMPPLQLVYEHTLAPYYESAYPSPVQGEFERLVASGGLDSLRYHLGGSRRQLQKLCLACIEEDSLEVGEPFWHRSHQLPGVAVCLRHRQWLTWSCAQCDWKASVRTVEQLRVSCPKGHTLRPQKPSGTLNLQAEMDFCAWSQELLAFEADERTWPLMQSLRGIAADRGFRGPGWTLGDAEAHKRIAQHAHPALTHGVRLLARVCTADYRHVARLVSGGGAPSHPHPVFVLLCVKALLGPNANTLEALREADPLKLSPSSRWLLVPPGRGDLRAQFLINHVLTRGLGEFRSVDDLDAGLASELGVRGGVIGHYRGRFPEFAKALAAARPDLFVRGMHERKLKELIASARLIVPGIEAKSARSMMEAFAKQLGMSRCGLRYYTKQFPELLSCLRQLRSELYGESRLPYLLSRLKSFPHAASGGTRQEYEGNLAAFLDVEVRQVRIYKKRFPEFRAVLENARPKLYLSKSERQLSRWLEILAKWGHRTKGASIEEFEVNLAARAGVGGHRVYEMRKVHPQFRQTLFTLRPDLYVNPGRSARQRNKLKVEDFIRCLKRKGSKTPGKSIAEYETNLGVLVDRSGAFVAKMRAHNVEVAQLLHGFRPDLYITPKGVRGPKFPIEEFTECVRRVGKATAGRTITEYQSNLGALVGRTGRRIQELRRKNREVAELLAELRPDLYC